MNPRAIKLNEFTHLETIVRDVRALEETPELSTLVAAVRDIAENYLEDSDFRNLTPIQAVATIFLDFTSMGLIDSDPICAAFMYMAYLFASHEELNV